MPKINFNADFIIGVGALVLGCLILFVWIPFDVETGLVEKVRSRIVIGDSLAPSLAASVLILGGVLLMFKSYRTSGRAELSWSSLKFIALILASVGLSLAVMRWTGPISAHLLNADYRSLRDTVPWKYAGYFWGGLVMVFGLISIMEHRLRWRILFISILAVLILMLVYDLPFKNLLLPPNGDI
jgi:uncharacterized membrane protein